MGLSLPFVHVGVYKVAAAQSCVSQKEVTPKAFAVGFGSNA